MTNHTLQNKVLRDRLYDLYRNVLTEKQAEIMDQYYYDDLTAAEIADNQGISRQAVHDTVKKAEQMIAEWESRLGYFAFILAHDALVEKVTEYGERQGDAGLLELLNHHKKEF